MNWLTQTTRFLQLDTPLGKDILTPIHFSGTEALSQPFNYSLQMISDDTAINPIYMVGQAVTLTIKNGGVTRYFNGYVHKFNAERVVEGARYYQAEIHPWISFLNFASNCQVFQQKTVIQIAQTIFEQFSFSHYSSSGLSKTYQSREYCVQYRETALHFISRLFQEEGIYYFFKQEENKHTLILADSPAGIKPIPDYLTVFDESSTQNNCITRLARNYQFYTGSVTHTDYNYQTPDTPLQAQQQSKPKLYAAQNYEHFDYPGLYQDYGTGQSLAQKRFEAQEAQYDTVYGESNCLNFSSGGKFSLENAPEPSDNGDFAITSITHTASDASYLHDNTGSQSYHNYFTCIPALTPFKPACHFIKPVVHGAQSALVVGNEGEELDTGEYGQVKVQFHWDRVGKKNEYSSCRIRVAQLWAGKNWGAVFMPRIGQEVLVHFLQGDPDRPIIMGTVYNADNMPPYSMPGEQSKSGIRTSSTKGAGADEYNELRFDDQQGREEIYIQAQKDFNKLVKNNMAVTVRNDHMHATANNSTITVGNDYSHSTTNNSSVFVGNDYSHSTENNSSVSVGNNYTYRTTNNVMRYVGNDYTDEIIHNVTQSIGNNYNQSIEKNANISVSNNMSQLIGKNFSMDIGSAGMLTATESLTLKVGGNVLLINSEGIYINGTQVKINRGT